MGGIGSGRSGGRPTVESCGLVLDINDLRRAGHLSADRTSSGCWIWCDGDEPLLRADFSCEAGPQVGALKLTYERQDYWTGKTHAIDDYLELVASPQPFGGSRWCFVCAETRRRVTRLYLPLGALQFQSRHAYQLGYKSQRQSLHDRAISRAWKARKGLITVGGIGTAVLRPKGMRQKTFERLQVKVVAADAVVQGHTALLTDTLMRKICGRGVAS